MDHLARKAVRGVAATGTQLVLVRALSLLTFVVLARLLTPRDYGIAAIAGVFAVAGSLLAAGGLSQAIVVDRELDDEHVDTVFWVSMAIGIGLALVLVAGSFPLASLLSLPELRAVLCAMAPMFVAIALGSTQTGLLQRQFRFATLARIGVWANVAATVVGIALAVADAGYWALVVQSFLTPILMTTALWVVSDYRPRSRPSWSRFADVFRTSRQFMGAEAMNFVYDQSDKLVVGRVLGAAALGTYAVAYRFAFLLLEVVTKSIQLVALPAFSSLVDAPERLRHAYATSARLAYAVSVPTFVVAGVCAEPITLVMFGDQWLAAVPAMQVFCAYGAVQSVVHFNLVFLQALGSARTVFRLSALGAVVQVAAVVVAAPHGLTWAAGSFVLRSMALAPLVTVVLHRRHPGTPALAALALTPVAVSAAASGAAAWGVTRLDLPAVAQLPLAGLAALVVYAGVLAVVGRAHLRDARRMVDLGRSPAPHLLEEAPA